MNTYFSHSVKDTKYEYPRQLTHREMGLTGAYDMDEEFLRLSFLQIRAGSDRPTEDQLNAAEHQDKELREANYRRMLGILEEAPKHPHAPMKYLKDHKNLTSALRNCLIKPLKQNRLSVAQFAISITTLHT
jgi:hypothetical protein